MQSYEETIQRMDNQCMSYMRQADEAYYEAGRHTKKECQLLQSAADIRGNMARISTGAEKRHYQQLMQELNARIRDTIRIMDPDYFNRHPEGGKSAAANSNTSAKSSDSAQTEQKTQKKDQSVSDEVVNSWIKPTPSHSFDDVTGMAEVKEKLRSCIDDIKLQAIKDYLGIRKNKTLFFVGPPGCGKTYIVEAFAHELADQGYSFMSLSSADILGKYVGDSEKIIKRLFEEALDRAPCIVFLDEIDGVCRNRNSPNLPEYASSMTTAFLMGYNTLSNSKAPVIFVGATNYPSRVDSAMHDRLEVVFLDFPDADARALKFRQELGEKIKLVGDFSFEEMADLTAANGYAHFNYRDIVRLCELIKLEVLKSGIKKYGDEGQTIDALKNGDFGLSREIFCDVLSGFRPSDKRAIIDEIDNFNKAYQTGELFEET